MLVERWWRELLMSELFLIWRLKDGGGNHWLMSCSGSDVLVEGWRIVLDLAVEGWRESLVSCSGCACLDVLVDKDGGVNCW